MARRLKGGLGPTRGPTLAGGVCLKHGRCNPSRLCAALSKPCTSLRLQGFLALHLPYQAELSNWRLVALRPACMYLPLCVCPAAGEVNRGLIRRCPLVQSTPPPFTASVKCHAAQLFGMPESKRYASESCGRSAACMHETSRNCCVTALECTGGRGKSPRREVVRSSAGASGVYPPFLGSFAQHTPRHDIGCPTPCKIIILPNKTIPQWIF